MPTEEKLREAIADVCRRIYEKGFVAANDGNVTARLDAERILATPSGVSKGDVTPESLLVCDLEGNRLAGDRKVTSEILLHCAVYRERADLAAVVHAHPPYATAITVAGVSLEDPVLPEVAVTFGTIPTADYATPASPEGPEVIRRIIRDHDALLLDRHGTLTAGRDPWEAYFRLEKVEHAAQVIFLAHQLGQVRTMSADEIDRLVAALERHGIAAKIGTMPKGATRRRRGKSR
ncbi:MAG TPA: class II aldolase/adducin family protein [Planctomycetota bacterium]|nr:class II aldolase/adducin family protein [Planctomycetota bacterium]